MKRSLTFWLTLLALLGALAWWGASRAFTIQAAAAVAYRGTAIHAVAGSVTISPLAESAVASPESGVLKESKITLGQAVRTGDVLAKLDPGQLPFRLAEARLNHADLERRLQSRLPSEIQLGSLQQDLADTEPLKQAGFSAPADFAKLQLVVSQQESLAALERSDLETRRAVLKNTMDDLEDQIRRLALLAPYDGTITAVMAFPGDLLSKGAPLARIVSQNMQIQAEVNQDDVAAIHDGQRAKIRFFAYGNREFTGKVKRVLPSSDRATQRFTIQLELVNPPPELIPGLTGEATFIAGEHPKALLIPRRALSGRAVALVQDGHVEIHEVQPGFLTLTEAEIVSGLKEGDVVLTENQDRFQTGQAVRVSMIADPPGTIKSSGK